MHSTGALRMLFYRIPRRCLYSSGVRGKASVDDEDNRLDTVALPIYRIQYPIFCWLSIQNVSLLRVIIGGELR